MLWLWYIGQKLQLWLNLSLGTFICHRWSHKERKKKKKTLTRVQNQSTSLVNSTEYSQLFQNVEERIFPKLILWCQSNAGKGITRKNHICKYTWWIQMQNILHKILGNQIQQYIRRSYTVIKWDWSQGYKDDSTFADQYDKSF